MMVILMKKINKESVFTNHENDDGNFIGLNNNETVSRNQESDNGDFDFKEMNTVETVFKPCKNFKAKGCSVTSGNTALSMKNFNQNAENPDITTKKTFRNRESKPMKRESLICFYSNADS